MTLTVGVDIGGSSVTAVARDDSGSIIRRHETRAASEGARQVAAAAMSTIRELGYDDCVAVGVGIPGQVDPVTGRVTMAVNLGIGSEPYDLAAELETRLGVPVTLENDVRAAALGAYESLVLAGSQPHSLALVGIGTGIAAGVVIEGEIVRGAKGMAGEIGHVVVDESGAMCRCGQRGCLEALAAGPAIARMWPRGETGTAATALFDAAASGDAAAGKVAARVVRHLVTALTWLAAAYDTEVIVLAGGVAWSSDFFLPAVRADVAERGETSELAARRLRPDQVILAAREDPPGPRGAALLAANYVLHEREAPATTKARK
jgi:predicted NBD/HSP70 family sugar kinase